MPTSPPNPSSIHQVESIQSVGSVGSVGSIASIHPKKRNIPYWYCLPCTPSLTLPPSSLKCLQKSNPGIHIKCFKCFHPTGYYKIKTDTYSFHGVEYGIGVFYDGFLPWELACGNYLRIILTRADTSDTSTLPSALISASSRLAVSPLRIIFTKVVTSVTFTFPSRLMRQSR